MITKSELQSKINSIKRELEARHKYGIFKMANDDGSPISTEALQKELFALIYKFSKMD